MFNTTSSIMASTMVFEILSSQVRDELSDISLWLETFNNCREQGFMLVATGKDKNNNWVDKYIWACESRNSDSIMVIIDTKRTINNMFSEEAYQNRKYFDRNPYEAAEYLADYLREIFEKSDT